MNATQYRREGFMISEFGIVKIIGGASLFAFAVSASGPFVGELINEATGVSLGVVGSVFMVAVSAIVWTLNERNKANKREDKMTAKISKQAESIESISLATNDLIDGQRALMMQVLKIGEHSGVPGCAQNLANMKAIDHVRKPPSTI